MISSLIEQQLSLAQASLQNTIPRLPDMGFMRKAQIKYSYLNPQLQFHQVFLTHMPFTRGKKEHAVLQN